MDTTRSTGTRFVRLIMLVCLLTGLFTAEASPQPSSTERVTLMIEEDTCSSARAEIETVLRRVHGVLAVDVRSVPQHALIDIERGAVTPDALAAAVQHTEAADARCRAVVMASCISTDSGGRAAK